MDCYNLSYNFNGNKFYFASVDLEGDSKNREAFVKFMLNKEQNKSQNFYDFETNKSIDIKKIDHISFHKDGQILITYKAKQKEHWPEHKLKYPMHSLPDDVYGALFVISINDLELHSKYIGTNMVKDIGVRSADINWNINNEPFSVVVFVFRDTLDPVYTMNTKFKDIFKIEDSCYFPYAINPKTGLYFALSKKVLLPKGDCVNPEFRIKNTLLSEMPPIGLSITPSDEKIRSLT